MQGPQIGLKSYKRITSKYTNVGCGSAAVCLVYAWYMYVAGVCLVYTWYGGGVCLVYTSIWPGV